LRDRPLTAEVAEKNRKGHGDFIRHQLQIRSLVDKLLSDKALTAEAAEKNRKGHGDFMRCQPQIHNYTKALLFSRPK
jgi:stalled ribosome alternative rescue factor ArfA